MKSKIYTVIIIICTLLTTAFILVYDRYEIAESRIDADNKESYSLILKGSKNNVESTCFYNSDKYGKLFLSNEDDVQSDGIKNLDEASTSVFKVNKSNIPTQLTLSDKEKLMEIASKLSVIDYERIKDDLYEKDSEKGVIDALKLLKCRLSSKDYGKLKQVAEKFINMNLVEK